MLATVGLNDLLLLSNNITKVSLFVYYDITMGCVIKGVKRLTTQPNTKYFTY